MGIYPYLVPYRSHKGNEIGWFKTLEEAKANGWTEREIYITMEKYGVVREYECECGQTIKVPDNSMSPEILKTGEVREPKHMHTFKEKADVTGETEGRVLRPDGLVGESAV